MQPLAPAIKGVWRVKIALVWAIILIAAFAVDLSGPAGADRVVPPGTVAAAVLLLGFGCIVVLPWLRYRFWRYELRSEELALTRGIWKRVHTTVPLRRIQHMDVSQGVIEAQFRVGRLIIQTAGRRGSVILPGLSFEEAERLRTDDGVQQLNHLLLQGR